MTVVAYKDGVLASDSQFQTNKTLVGYGEKIIKTKGGILAGAAGNFVDIKRFLNLVRDDQIDEIEDVPFDSFEGIVVYPDGRALLYEDKGGGFAIEAPFYAFGSGADIAIGAMFMGASAEEAVKAAIEWDTGCGGNVQIVRLNDGIA